MFKLKDTVFVTEFEIGLDDGYIYLAGVLSDAGAIYLLSDSSNVKKLTNKYHIIHRLFNR